MTQLQRFVEPSHARPTSTPVILTPFCHIHAENTGLQRRYRADCGALILISKNVDNPVGSQ
ncbi:hypothetical protein [Pseudomonas sp. SLFW]|uniref:hypothetical protein n=1 Tax=Pseudomonas sp. SLFW TaxID=2683259 RepID=UPI001411BC95|nr:hypothetical protein [Pseudomonas sp. SLFW]NBB10068.1 hypothetical protein [Pseudomonas sp. SLFW]